MSNSLKDIFSIPNICFPHFTMFGILRTVVSRVSGWIMQGSKGKTDSKFPVSETGRFSNSICGYKEIPVEVSSLFLFFLCFRAQDSDSAADSKETVPAEPVEPVSLRKHQARSHMRLIKHRHLQNNW